MIVLAADVTTMSQYLIRQFVVDLRLEANWVESVSVSVSESESVGRKSNAEYAVQAGKSTC